MESCSCCGPVTMILPCSGGSNVGQLSNEVAKQLTIDGKGLMFCLAGLGGDIEPMLERARGAARILVIDGCPVACAKKTVERHDLGHEWLELTSLGIDKCPELELDAETVACAMRAAEQMLEA